ncbi:MAG TPA: type I polyketide synthase, partial [Polyangium sp.]|nr:type I polyketide synthase [Polyangium sp.]
GLSPRDIDIVEAHGTGTKLGDPIEALALLNVYGRDRSPDDPLWIGSVKSNLGHTQAAAGVGGVMKVLLGLQHGLMPKTLHADNPSPYIDWSSGQVKLLQQHQPWRTKNRPRRAGVSSFGISGTNAHIILEEAPIVETSTSQTNDRDEPLLFVLSGKTASALRGQAAKLHEHLAGRPQLKLADVAYSLADTRTHFPHRAAIVAHDREMVLQAIDALAREAPAEWLVQGQEQSSPKVAFVFPGQGGQWLGMGRELLQSSPVFRAELEACASDLAPHISFSLLDMIARNDDANMLERVDIVQPVLFAIMVALAALWRSLGIVPDAVVGHSQGEIAAAYVAGALSLEDACRIVAIRSRLLAQLDGSGAMASVELSAEELALRIAHLGDKLTIAAHNSPHSLVISGAAATVDAMLADLAADQVFARKIRVGYASHCHHVEIVREQLCAALAAISPRASTIPFYSTVTGRQQNGTELDAAYWYENLRRTVLFCETSQALLADSHKFFVEISPHPVLVLALEKTAASSGMNSTVLGTLRRNEEERARVLLSLGQLFVGGVAIKWEKVLPSAHRIPLPTYAFQRERYWLKAPNTLQSSPEALGLVSPAHPLVSAAISLAADDSYLFTSRLSLQSHPWLGDHVVFDNVLVPGAALLELAFAAARHVDLEYLDDMTLEAPLVVPQKGAVRVQVLIGPPNERSQRAITVFSRDENASEQSPWTRNATATFTPGTSRPTFDFGEWPPPDATPIDLEDFYSRLALSGIDYGPEFQGLQKAWKRGLDWYVEAALSEELARDARNYGIHPALMDAVLQTIALRSESESGASLLFGMSGVALCLPGSSAVRARLSPSATGGAISLEVAGTDGSPVLIAEALHTRPLSRDQLPRPGVSRHDALFAVQWTKLSPDAAPIPTENWAWIGDVPRNELPRPYTTFHSMCAELDPEKPVPQTVIVFEKKATASLVDAAHDTTCRTLALLQEWLADERFESSQLVFVTRNAVATIETEGVGELAHVPIWGLVRCAQAENPDRSILLVDIDDTDASFLALSRAIATHEPQVAIRQGALFSPRLVPATALPNSVFPVDSRGTVLITGGMGPLGRLLAKHLATRHGVLRMLLTSRQGPNAPGADDFRRQMEEIGVKLTISSCDVADPSALRKLLESIPKEHPLVGLVHTAAVLDDGTIRALTPEQVARALRPKVDAAVLLDELTRDMNLSFFILYSSLAGVVGGPGQGSYAAGNAFLDALAISRRVRGLPAVAIAWGSWGEAGMLTRLSDADRVRMRRAGVVPLSSNEGLDLFEMAIRSSSAAVVAARFDLEVLRERTDVLSPMLSTLLPAKTKNRTTTRRASAPGATILAQLRGLSKENQARVILDMVRAETAAVLGHSDVARIPADAGFMNLGLDSLTSIELRRRLQQITGLPLPATIAFDHPSPGHIATFLLDKLAPDAQRESAMVHAPRRGEKDESIAIVGIALNLPGGAKNLDELWSVLANSLDAVRPVPAHRWDADAFYDPNPETSGKSYVREAAFLDHVDLFDAAFFGISPREATYLDPQQRLLLEAAWHAFENAGIVPGSLVNSATGVFVGVSSNGYALQQGLAADAPVYAATGTQLSFTAGRIAYSLGLQGPALSVDTACSSSLVALHLACQALRRGECDLALACGAQIMAGPEGFVILSRSRALAPDGRSKTFSAQADGFGRGEGVVVLVLERLEDARKRGRDIYAIIRGSAMNHDGQTSGITVPNGTSQQKVLRGALEDAHLLPTDVDAVECHGTGTSLGDPIEVQALDAIYGQGRAKDQPLLLGAIKTNIGHLEAAAGLAGVAKIITSLHHGALPPTLHSSPPNPHIDWEGSSMHVVEKLQSWEPAKDGKPRRAGISAFGFSGTNAHVILEEAPPSPKRSATEKTSSLVLPLLLSARTDTALYAQAQQLHEYLQRHSPVALEDIAFSLATTRTAFEHRAVVVADDHSSALESLALLSQGKSSPRIARKEVAAHARIAVLFTGQGSQRVGMGRELYLRFPAFSEVFDQICAHFDPEVDQPLHEVLFAAEGSLDAGRLDQTVFAQPGLFALEVALYRLLETWGLTADVFLGHSIGELVAAHLAGVFSLRDACVLVAARGRLMQALPAGGAMTAFQATEDEVAPLLVGREEQVSIAAINGPNSIVIAGDEDAVQAIEHHFDSLGRKGKRLRVSHAFHSPRMEPMLAEFERIAATIEYHAPRLPIISNVTGKVVNMDEITSSKYWVRHVRD